MPTLRRRPLRRAAMVGRAPAAPAGAGRHPRPATPEAERRGALSRLERLFESGVLTREQRDAERWRILAEG